MKTAFASVAALFLLLQTVGRAAPAPPPPADALKFFKNYFVTGDYVVGGIGLRGTGVNGMATGSIDMTGASIPDGVDVLAAFLYWETVDLAKNGNKAVTGATFNGGKISDLAVPLNPAGTAPCWSSGGGTGGADGAHKMFAYRADVLRFLPLDEQTNKYNVKTLHEVRLPDGGGGNTVPSTAGASLVVVYREEGLAVPLKSIVFYDGGYTMDQSTNAMNLTIKGFYQSDPGEARLTHIVGDGQPNFSERLLFNGSPIGLPNPFVGKLGPTSDPAWDSEPVSIPVASSITGSVTTSVDHLNFTPFDCLSWGAVVFSIPVRDTDGDGLLNIWETSSTLTDPNGQPLPNLPAMNANPDVKDVFIEIGYLKNDKESFNPAQGKVPPHDHMPSKAALDMLGNAFAKAPFYDASGNLVGIRVHFDVGPDLYQGDPFVIPGYVGKTNVLLAKGGDIVPEVEVCAAGSTACHYPDFDGTLGWKSAYRYYRDMPLNMGESQCVAAERDPAKPPCLRRFDHARKDIFHYALFAHAIGLPRLNAPNIPANTSGIADLVGGDILVTLGLWHSYLSTDAYVASANGTDYMTAATFMHELGHNFGLRHGGEPLEFNCKPNYFSIMNYLFQARGLLTLTGTPVLDYSRDDQVPALDPNKLRELAPFSPPHTLPYVTRWYTSKDSSFIDRDPSKGGLGTTPATRHCNGSPITEGIPWVRVDGTTVDPPIDWNADGLLPASALADVPYSQDISFNGIKVNGLFPVLKKSVNDWARVDLRQIGGRRNTGSERTGGALSLDLAFGDVGVADKAFGDVGFGNTAFGDVAFGDVAFGDVGVGDKAFGDVGTGDRGAPDDEDAPLGDLDLDTATAVGNAPDSLKAVNGKNIVNLSWAQTHVGAVNFYTVYRVLGASITPTNLPVRVTVATPFAPTTTATDSTAKNNTTYTYFVVATFYNGQQSGISNAFTLTVK